MAHTYRTREAKEEGSQIPEANLSYISETILENATKRRACWWWEHARDAHTKEKAVGRGVSRKRRRVSRCWGDHNTSYAHMKWTGDFKKNKQEQRFIILSWGYSSKNQYTYTAALGNLRVVNRSVSIDRLPSHETAERKPFIRPNYCGYYQMMDHTPLYARLWAEHFTYITLHNLSQY